MDGELQLSPCGRPLDVGWKRRPVGRWPLKIAWTDTMGVSWLDHDIQSAFREWFTDVWMGVLRQYFHDVDLGVGRVDQGRRDLAVVNKILGFLCGC